MEYFEFVGDGVVRLVEGGLVEPALNVDEPVVVVGLADGLVDPVEDVARPLQALAHGHHFVAARLRVLGQVLQQQRVLGQPLHGRRDDVLELQPPAHRVPFGFR